MSAVKKNIRFPAPAQDQFMYLARSLHDCQGRCTLTFAESIDSDRLSRAFRLTLDVEPILACRFVPRPWKPFWQLRDDLQQISTCAASCSNDVENDSFKFLAEPLDPEKDAQIQMRIFRSHSDTLCVKINHMVTDGGGLLEYLHLLGHIYKKLGENADYVVSGNGIHDRGQGQVFRRVGIRQLLRGARHYKLPAAAWGFPMTNSDFSGRTFIIRRLPGLQIDALKQFSRAHQASVNHVLHAAFYRALFELLDPPFSRELPIEATVNLRPYLSSDRAARICNLASAFFPSLTRKANEPFLGTLHRLQALFEKAKNEQPWLGAALGIEAGFLFGFSVADYVTQYFKKRVVVPGNMHPFFANFGHIDASMVDFGSVRVTDLAMIGPVPFPPASILSVHSFNDTMYLTTGYCHTAVDPQVMERFLDLFVAELPM